MDAVLWSTGLSILFGDAVAEKGEEPPAAGEEDDDDPMRVLWGISPPFLLVLCPVMLTRAAYPLIPLFADGVALPGDRPCFVFQVVESGVRLGC